MASVNKLCRLIHLDLKGLPPSPKRLLELPELIASLGFTGILMEYEDTFPFRHVPQMNKQYTYSVKTLRNFLGIAGKYHLQIIPLIQTFGHLESLLKYKEFHSLRELPDDPRVLCPLNPQSRKLISQMISEIIEVHQEYDLQYIHLGADEVFTLGSCPRCKKFVKQYGKSQLYLDFLNPLIDQVNNNGIRVLIWHDMLRDWPMNQLKTFAGRADLMFWNYGWVPGEIEAFCSPRQITACQRAGIGCWGAAAYKGADGCDRNIPDIFNRARNTFYWTQQALKNNFKGVCLTGWSRYMSTWACSEPLEGSWESLAVCSQILATGRLNYPQVIEQARRQLYGVSDPSRQPCRKNELLWKLNCSLSQLENWCRNFDVDFYDRIKVQFPYFWKEDRRNLSDKNDCRIRYQKMMKQFPTIAKSVAKYYQNLAPASEIRYFLKSRLIPRQKIWNLLKQNLFS